MANYHCAVRNISRNHGKGKSSVAAAAYRAGETLHDERTGKTHYYANRQRDIILSKIFAPDNAPEWAYSRTLLWNKVEQVENRVDARTAKEIIVTLPYELDRVKLQETVASFVKKNIVEAHNVAADVAIHRYGRKTTLDDTNRINAWKKQGLMFLSAKEADSCDTAHVKMLQDHNGAITGYKLYQPHAHILVTMRGFDSETKHGMERRKNRNIDNRNQLIKWREAWQDNLNNTFERLGLDIRLSCKPKSYNADNDNNQAINPIEWQKDQVVKYDFELEQLETMNKNDNNKNIDAKSKLLDELFTKWGKDYDQGCNSQEIRQNFTIPDFNNDTEMKKFRQFQALRKNRERPSKLYQDIIGDTERMFRNWETFRAINGRGKQSYQTDKSNIAGYTTLADKSDLER